MTKIQANTIIHGDCVKVLHELPEQCAQFILTDPPYLVSYKSRDGRKVPNDDNDAWLEPICHNLKLCRICQYL